MRLFRTALLAVHLAIAVSAYRTEDFWLFLLASITVIQSLLRGYLLTVTRFHSQQTGPSLNHALHESETLSHSSTDNSGPTDIAPSNHVEHIERYHACRWKFVPPHLRDPVRLLRSFIEVNRTRVEQAIWLAEQIPDLMDARTLSQSRDFLLLSHVVTPPSHPSLPAHLKDKRIVDTAYRLFTKPAYRLIYHADYVQSTASLLDRVLMSMGKLPLPRPDYDVHCTFAQRLRFTQARPLAFMEWKEEWGACPYPKPNHNLYEGFLLGDERGGISILHIEHNEPFFLV